MAVTTGRQKTVSRVLIAPDTFTSTLTTIFTDEFGLEALTWHPQTIKLETEDAFGITLPPGNYDRLMAGITLVTSDWFYKNLNGFLRLCDIMSGGLFDPTTTVVPGSAELAWGITEALVLGPPEPGDDEPFTEEILRYLGMILDREGIMAAPDVLAIGLRREKDQLARALADCGDDPGMASAIQDVAAIKTTAINDLIKSGLVNMLKQLESLQLTNGNAGGLLKQLQGRPS